MGQFSAGVLPSAGTGSSGFVGPVDLSSNPWSVWPELPIPAQGSALVLNGFISTLCQWRDGTKLHRTLAFQDQSCLSLTYWTFVYADTKIGLQADKEIMLYEGWADNGWQHQKMGWCRNIFEDFVICISGSLCTSYYKLFKVLLVGVSIKCLKQHSEYLLNKTWWN